MGEVNRKLHFISYSDLNKWDTKFYLTNETIFNPRFKQVLFGDFLSKASIQKVKIEDDEKYKILGVRSYGKGVYLNRESLGKDLKMKEYYKAKPNHLFWCKVDTKNGAFGVVNNELADGFGSSNMTFAEIDTNKINVDFLQLLFTSKKIHSYLDSFVTGTTNRKYIRPDQLLEEIYIPLPTIQEQQAIVDAYFSKINEATQLEVEANNIDKEIEKYLFTELGISIGNKNGKKKGLNLLEFSQLERWDTLYLLNNLNETKGKYKNVKFSNIITSFNKEGNKGIRVDSSIKFPLDNFHYIGMENIEKESGNLLGFQKVIGQNIKSQTLRVPKGFFIYGKLRPYLNKYWINNTDFENIICSSEFFVFDISENINKIFFREVLASQFIQEQISDKTSGARMPRINEDIFYNLYFPLPPKDIQVKLANETGKLRNSKMEKLAFSDQLKYQANEEFEKAIFH